MNLAALERLDQEIAKTEARIEVYKEKAKALRQRKLDEENAQIIKLVREANMSVREIHEMFQPARQETIIMEEESDV